MNYTGVSIMRVLMIVMLVVICRGEKYNDYQGKLLLAVYYESKCPDSVKFISQQLVPTMNRLHKYIDLTLVPFGKARSIPSKNRNQQIEFICQHGSSECLGNRVQNCALHYMQDRSDQERLNYVACEMERFEAVKGSYGCIQEAGLSEFDVNSCVTSNEGTELQLLSEHATKQLSPRFIPTITINGVFDQHNQNRALHDLIGTLCSLMLNEPTCASHRYNTDPLAYVYTFLH